MDMLVLMIDERITVSSKLIAASENNQRQNIFGGGNLKQYFSVLPVVILFGDNQFLLIGGGTINGL